MSRLTQAIAIRPGEARLVVLVAGAFAAVEAGRGLGEVGIETLVINRIGPQILPPLYIGLGLVGLVVTLTYSTALTRSSSPRFFPGLLTGLSGVLAAEWVLALSGIEAVLLLVYVSVFAAGLLLLTAMWTVGGFTFDARQAKRLFPLLTSAAIVGSLAGFLSAIVIQRIVGAEALILAEAAMFLVAALLLHGLGPRIRPRRPPGTPTPTVRAALTNGASYVAASPLMRLVAVAYVLLAILMFSLTFPFMSAMNEAFPVESELLTVLALFSAAVTIVSFLAGTLLANRLYARFGVTTVALALPVMYLLGFGLWIVRFGLVTAIVARFAQQVTQRGVSNAAFSAFYNVVPSARRGQVLAFMDGVPGQLGAVLSGVLIIIASSLAMEQVFQLGLVTAVLCIVVLVLIRRAYASSLMATLREGRAERLLEGGPGLAGLEQDAGIITELRSATTSERPAERLLAAELLGRLGVADAAPELEALLSDEDAEIRRTALRTLAHVRGVESMAAVKTMLTDADASVRAAALAVLAAIPSGMTLETASVAELELDADPVVRGELAVFLGRHNDHARSRAIVETLVSSSAAADRASGLDAMARLATLLDRATALDLSRDPSPHVRAAAMRAMAADPQSDLTLYLSALDDDSLEVRTSSVDVLHARSDALPSLVATLNSGSDRAQQGALAALEGRAEQVRVALLEWARAQVRRATELRSHALALSGAAADSTAGFLGAVVARREVAIESRLLQALAVLGAPEASGLIRRCLHARDAEVRAQAIEAIDSIGDPSLAREVVRLLDRDVGPQGTDTADMISAATALRHDRDVWVRALALRTLSEQSRSSQPSLAEPVRDDPEPVVHEAVEIEEAQVRMPESLRSVRLVDRMLVLRRVPLFAALEPEDLQRVAVAATEQSWADGEVLMAEGDIADELVVIVEGGVRVVHYEGESEREVRTYGEGDHIGELAVLRQAPRAATVVAGEQGVRGLVIDGQAVQALLRERPDAAMAMLATLAERISQQA